MKPFRFEVITPDRVVFDREVIAVTVPAEGGSLGVLAGHAPLLATVEVGVVKVTEAAGSVLFLMVGDGFLEVQHNQVRLLAEVGEREDQIDLGRAAAAEKRARERLHREGRFQIDLARAQAALARSLVRQKILRDLVPFRDGRRQVSSP